MTYPLHPPYNKVTTRYGVRGRSWGCGKDTSGRGVHTGVDLAAPKGTPIYAPCDGQIRHRNYGAAFGNHQFAISPDAGQEFAKGEIFFAHTATRMADGAHVKMGQQIAAVGVEGNTTGPHLHMEYHPNTKGQWNCNAHGDPQPVLEYGKSSAVAKPTNGPFTTKDVYRSKCGYGEPSNGDTSSDSVKELQERLNRAGLTGGQKLVTSGRYDELTDRMVRLWQEQVAKDKPDAPRRSYLGPKQFDLMFPKTTYIQHDDGDPKVAEPPVTTVSAMGKRFQRANKYVTAKVVYEHNWDNDLIAGKGPWSPSFFLLHHTGIKDDPDKGNSSRGWVLSGGTYAPVRLCNWLVDRDGTLRVIAARKAYQAGKGSGHGVPQDEMNDVSAGVEIESMGKRQDLTSAQVLTVSQLTDGWMEEFKIPITKVINHKDWSSTGKTDTLYPIGWWYERIRNWRVAVKPPVITPPVEPPVEAPKSINFPLGIQYWYSGKPPNKFIFGGDYKKLDVLSWAPKRAGLTFGMVRQRHRGRGVPGAAGS